MNAASESVSPAETYILGGEEAPVVEEEPMPSPIAVRPQPQQVKTAPQPQPEPQRRWGLFGAKKPKEESRLEPAALPIQRNTLQPRASAQVMTRAQQPADKSPVDANDLFPDHKRDEQFEIPAFLRRQSN
jgi:cell division protein FtsZ